MVLRLVRGLSCVGYNVPSLPAGASVTSLSFGLGIMPDSHSTVAVVGGTLGPHRPVCVPARSLTSRGED